MTFHQGGAYEKSGRQWRAQDIGIKEKACPWMPHGFMRVNTKLEAGRAFLRSLYKQYAAWGVDFGNLNFILLVLYVMVKLNYELIVFLAP